MKAVFKVVRILIDFLGPGFIQNGVQGLCGLVQDKQFKQILWWLVQVGEFYLLLSDPGHCYGCLSTQHWRLEWLITWLSHWFFKARVDNRNTL